jgi:hypothetical protein
LTKITHKVVNVARRSIVWWIALETPFQPLYSICLQTSFIASNFEVFWNYDTRGNIILHM